MREIALWIVIALTLLQGCSHRSSPVDVSNDAGKVTDSALVVQGAYVARLADCAACHTALHDQLYAGGLEIKRPIGIIYSSNITSDPTHGFGNYSLQEFGEAVRHGIRKDGVTLYPAMPYPSFSRMSGADIKALYAYFMHGVAPVDVPNKSPASHWPLSMRWPVAIWRKKFAPAPKPFSPAAGLDPVVALGQYLVEGPGHCGACHTPRGFAMQEKALTATGGANFLAGGAPVDGWVAPSLRDDPTTGLGRWSSEDIQEFLKSGRTHRAAAFGGMTHVVAWSTRYFNDDDLHAIAVYLKSLPQSRPRSRLIDRTWPRRRRMMPAHKSMQANARYVIRITAPVLPACFRPWLVIPWLLIAIRCR